MEDVGQTAHLERHVLQNGAHQLADDDAVMVTRPDRHGELHGLHRLPREREV